MIHPDKLKALQKQLGKTQSEMAGMAGYQPSVSTKDGALVPDGAKWRKVTLPLTSTHRKNLSATAAFHLAAHLVLSADELEKIKLKIDELTID